MSKIKGVSSNFLGKKSLDHHTLSDATQAALKN